jgi:hypothetical protein
MSSSEEQDRQSSAKKLKIQRACDVCRRRKCTFTLVNFYQITH